MKRLRMTPLDRECDHCLTRRASAALFVLVAAFSVISGRIFYLQMMQHKVWATKAEKNRVREDELPAPRGPILDTHMRLLTNDEALQSVVFDNMALREYGPVDKETGKARSLGGLDRMAQALAKSEQRPWAELRNTWTEKELQQRFIWWMSSLVAPALEQTPEEISKLITDRTNNKGELRAWDSGESILAKEINAMQANRLNKILEENPLGCLRIKSFYRRSPLNDPELTPLVGLINVASQPVGGIEAARNAELTGVPGKRTYEVDTSGREVSGFQNQIIEPQQGKSLRLSLDTTMQDIVAGLVDQVGNDPNEVYLPPLKPARVMVVLMDAKTMAIRAIVCRDADQKPGDLMLQNAAAVEIYEPGSTMKICTLAAALDSGKVNLNTYIAINGPTYDDAEVDPITDDEPFSSLSVRDVLVHSSNIGAYKLGRTVGTKRIQECFLNFGFGSRTNFMGIAESTKQTNRLETPGMISKNWTTNVLARTCFGYNIAVTPIQMCSALGVILNDGWYREPYLVEAVMDSRNRVLEEHQAKNIRRVVSANAAKGTREAMLDVVERGTGSKAQSRDYLIAGKTGTSKKARADGKGYEEGKYVVSFLGFAPANDPKLIGVVVVDSPRGDRSSLYGGKVAAPVFRRIMESALRYYEVPGETITHVAKPRHP